MHTAQQAHTQPAHPGHAQPQHTQHTPAQYEQHAQHTPGQHDQHGQNDPRVGWTTSTDSINATAPVLLQRRDGILPAVAAALSIRGETLTCTGSRGDRPPTHHPLVQDFLDTLTTERRARHTGRCPEAVLLSRFLTATETARAGKRTARRPAKNGKAAPAKATKAPRPAKPPKPLTLSEAKRALKHAKLTARRIREDGDPLHGSYAPPCRSCGALLSHFGVRAVDPAQEHSQ
ncbi:MULTISPECIES: YwqJ-related putative deaminase [unclassified Streptomyces]|uniref:YwqJ-related putative deaminase n=1 Tax=unclassified Streptomyces TaxID=2593676 RepID=UPI002DD7F3D6|nr:YwqJ-related putative deaminase [Streptomyces sp. NBC_01795]WSA94261.1 YwqJ-related putative deaminase [Streptomyces sp. NBC_01795]WSS41901.1 YwqJ-related putative deaminase [Streptomyces sp. NBC_01187]